MPTLTSLVEAGNQANAGDYDSAGRTLRAGERGPCVECMALWRGLLWEAAGVADSAIAGFEDYLDKPYNVRQYLDPLVLGALYEKLARLYEEKGDLENAAVYYAKLTKLWADADPELQPRVRTAETRLEEIVRARG